MAVFYLLRPPLAIPVALVTVAALVPILKNHIDSLTVAVIVMTILVMSAFAFAFSLISNRRRADEALYRAKRAGRNAMDLAS